MTHGGRPLGLAKIEKGFLDVGGELVDSGTGRYVLVDATFYGHRQLSRKIQYVKFFQH